MILVSVGLPLQQNGVWCRKDRRRLDDPVNNTVATVGGRPVASRLVPLVTLGAKSLTTAHYRVNSMYISIFTQYVIRSLAGELEVAKENTSRMSVSLVITHIFK